MQGPLTQHLWYKCIPTYMRVLLLESCLESHRKYEKLLKIKSIVFMGMLAVFLVFFEEWGTSKKII